MDSLDTSRIISMTELQKLSLKKLRRFQVPLFVIDRKSKKGGFVILDLETFKNLGSEVRSPDGSPASKQADRLRKKLLAAYDFRGQGLLWDRPEIDNRTFYSILNDPNHSDHRWATSRILERLPSAEVLRLFPLATIETMLKGATLRETFRRPWEHAIRYWRQKTPCPG